MAGKQIFLTVIAVTGSFIIGFFIANVVNRGELDDLKIEIERLKAPVEKQTSDNDLELTAEEIRAKVAEADGVPDNAGFQIKLGLALYRYGSMKRDVDVIREAERLLRRANTLEKNNFDVLVGLGHANFDIAYFGNWNEGFSTSRKFYQYAVRMRPDDAEVPVDIAISYYLQQPPDLDSAAAKFEQALRKNPKNERALEFLIRTLLKQNKSANAAANLEKLRSVNPGHPSLGELTSLVGGNTISEK